MSDKVTRLLLWQLPTAAIVASSVLQDSSLKAGIWTAGFAQMGAACLANAAGCGRLHCYFTGPFFLLGSLGSLLRGMRLLTTPWPVIGLTMLGGWLILGHLPERVWGKYTARRSGAADRFDRFTDRARRVLRRAQDEARGFQHNYIGTEHLLLGLIGEDQGVAAKVLSERGVELGKARSAVEQVVGRGERAASGPIGLTPRAKRVLELSVAEARRLKHSYIGTEHLLLGLVREGESVAVGVLDSLGVSTNLATMRDQVTDLFSRN